MRRILAIAGLAVRAAVRSRLVLCLLLLLLATVVGLPLTVQGDGTPEGHVRIVIGYTMGFASLVLSLTALWSGALTIAREIDDKQIQLLCSKPVHRAEIWFGKWLGLTAVHAGLLALSALATYVTLELTLRGPRFSVEQRAQVRAEVLTARRVITPQPVDVETAARAEVQRRLRAGEVPEDVSPAELLPRLRQEMLVMAHTIEPGARREWRFILPDHLDPQSELRIKFRFSTSRLGQEPARGTWMIGPPGETPLFRAAFTNTPGVPHLLRLPASVAAGGSQLSVQYLNDDPDPFTVVFPPQDGLAVLTRAGAFVPNFLRAVLVVAFRLALLVAIGVTASTLFSTPVATLMALAAVIILQAGSYVGSMAHQPQITPWSGNGPPTGLRGLMDFLIRQLFRLLDLLLAPLQSGRPLDDAATGLWVSPALVARSGLIQVLLYGGLLALLATAAFNRREVARPTP